MNPKKTSRPSNPLRLSRETIQHLKVRTGVMTGPVTGHQTPKCNTITNGCGIQKQ